MANLNYYNPIKTTWSNAMQAIVAMVQTSKKSLEEEWMPSAFTCRFLNPQENNY